MAAMLNGDGREPRERFTIRVIQRGQVTDNKSLGMPWHGKVRFHDDAANAVELYAE